MQPRIRRVFIGRGSRGWGPAHQSEPRSAPTPAELLKIIRRRRSGALGTLRTNLFHITGEGAEGTSSGGMLTTSRVASICPAVFVFF